MNQESQPCTPKTLVDKRFRIPLYQRPYAWEAAQVEQLLNDLLTAHINQPDEDYHMGLLSVAPSVDDGMLDLIDGQQRMTTLMLIGKAAAEDKDQGIWSKFCTDDRLKLYGREGDQYFLRTGSVLPGSTVNKKMQEARECAKVFFDKTKEKRKAFSKFIFEHAAFFLAYTPAKYSPKEMNQHFVRMNNRGKQLEPHEILKVRLFGKIKDRPKHSERLTTWNEMVACLSGSGAVDGSEDVLAKILNSPPVTNGPPDQKEVLYSAILTIPEFLLIALSRSVGEKIQSGFKDTLLETFETYINTDAEKIEKFLDVLEEQLASLKKFFIFIAKSGEGYELRAKTEDSKDDTFDFGADQAARTKDHLLTVQSYLHVSTDPLHWLPLAFDYCKSKEELVATEFVKELERIDNQLICDKTRRISELKVDMAYNAISHYWFYRLDYELWKCYRNKMPNAAEGKESQDIWGKLTDNGMKAKLKDFRFRRCGSVEHMNPQNGTTLDEKTLHSFGNLALIPSPENSKFSDFFASEKKRIIGQSDRVLYSLKMLHFLWCIDDFDPGAYTDKDKDKTIKAIKMAGDQMFNLLLMKTVGCDSAKVTEQVAPQATA
jgi:hypothetical protein